MSIRQTVALLGAVAVIAYVAASAGANRRSEPDQAKTQRPYDDATLKRMEQFANRGSNASFTSEERQRVETAGRQIMGLQPAYMAQFSTPTLAAMVLQTMKNRNAVYEAANPVPRAGPDSAPYVAPRAAPYVPPQYSVPSSAPLVPPQYVADPSKSSWQEDERQRADERQQRDAEQRLRDAERQSCQALQVAVANRDPNAPYDAFAPRAPLYCP